MMPDAPEENTTGFPGLRTWRSVYTIVLVVFVVYVVLLTLLARIFT